MTIKLNGYAKWVGIIITVLITIGSFLFATGVIKGNVMTTQSTHETRLGKIEDKCKDYDKKLTEIQTDVSFIRGYITKKIP